MITKTPKHIINTYIKGEKSAVKTLKLDIKSQGKGEKEGRKKKLQKHHRINEEHGKKCCCCC